MSDEDNSFEDIEEHLEMERIRRQSHLVEQSNNVLSTIMIVLDTTDPINDLECGLYRGLWEAAKALIASNPFVDQDEFRVQLERFRQKWERK